MHVDGQNRLLKLENRLKSAQEWSATQAALNRVPVAFPATLRYQLAAAIYRGLNNALELFLFTTLSHNLVLATPRSIPI